MVLDSLLDCLSQAQTLSDLDSLLDDKTLNGILTAWIFDCEQANFSKRTKEHYLDKVSDFLRFLGKEITLPEQVRPLYIALFLTNYRKTIVKRTGEHPKPSSEHDYYRAIHRYFSYMVEHHILDNHPMEKMRPPKVPLTVITPYNRNDLELMISLCDAEYKFHHAFTAICNKAILLIYASSGSRRQEMAEIKKPSAILCIVQV